jgi:selenide,water dikinase
MAEIIKGAVDKTNEADCPIIGGHTIEDAELKFGLSVTGLVNKDAVITNAGAQPGDILILTKPLGMGILTTALKAGKLEPETIKKITDIMSQLNKAASEVMTQFDVHAATDITGFGLLGHAHNMARASQVSMVLQADAIPCLPEAVLKMKEGGYIPGGTMKNKQYLEKTVSFSESIDEMEQLIYYDAQTSGGLCIAVHPEQAEDIMEELRDRDVPYAQVVGEVIQVETHSIHMRK